MDNPKKNRKIAMTEGDVKNVLLRLTFPMMTGFVAMIIFNTADMIYVGRLGSDELAAITFTFPVAMLFISIAHGLGIGASSVVSREIGAGNFERGKKVTTHTIILALLISATISTVGFFTIDPLFTIMGAEEELRPLIKEYMQIWYIGIVFVMVPMVGNNIIRATGDAKTPMYIMLLAALFNIILDPLLIFGLGPFPRLELAGAAIATVIARGTTMVVTLYILVHRDKMVDLTVPSFGELKECWRSVLHVGAPAAVTNLLFPLSLGILTYLSALHGKDAVAALGVGTRLDFIALLPLFGISASLLPFVGQNVGAGESERVKKAVFMSIRFSFYWGFGSAVVLALLSDYVGLAFTSDEGILEKLKIYLFIIPVGYAFQGVVALSSGYFNASGKPLPAALLNFTRLLLLLVPFAVVGNYYFGFSGIVGAVSLAAVLTGVMSIVWMEKDIQKTIESAETKPMDVSSENNE